MQVGINISIEHKSDQCLPIPEMDFSKLLYGFVKIDRWISLSCYIDLPKLLHGFELKVLNESKYSK